MIECLKGQKKKVEILKKINTKIKENGVNDKR